MNRAPLAVITLSIHCPLALGQPGLPTWSARSDAAPQPVELVSVNQIAGNRLQLWHRDGPDCPPVLALVAWTRINGVQGSMATWDGQRWELYPAFETPGSFGRSILFDFDAAGPQPERIVALRDGSPHRVAFWNGSEWEPLPGWDEATPHLFGDLASFDPDADGPQPAMLVGANKTVNLWNGSGWTQIGETSGTLTQNFLVNSAHSYDPDGPGPALPNLYIGGTFDSVSGVEARRIARWDGAAWHALSGATLATNPGIMAVHDFDAAGPRLPELLVGAQGTYGSTLASLAAWNGSTWRPLGGDTLSGWSPTSPTNVLSTGAFGVLVHGSFTSYGASPLNRVGVYAPMLDLMLPLTSFEGAGFDQGNVSSIVLADLDGTGPAASSLFALGTFLSSGGHPVNTIARWNGREWQPVTGTFDAEVNTVAAIDPDADGPLPDRTYYGGRFSTLGGAAYQGTAVWDGHHASPMGAGVGENGVINPGSVLNFDPDAEGPQPASLILSGYYVQRWNGLVWENIWTGSSQMLHTRKMCVHDFDGAGPQPARLILATSFYSGMGQVIQYDGAAWSPIGGGIGMTNTAGGRTVLSYDHDGDGPALPILYATGWIADAEGQPINGAAYFDEAGWHPMGEGWGVNAPLDMIPFDPDGDGPRAVEIIAGGPASSAPGVARGVCAWNGKTWTPLGDMNHTTYALAVFDSDGDGPRPPRLIAAGSFLASGSTPLGRIAQWNTETQEWEPLFPADAGLDGVVKALTIERPFGPGGPERLVVAGSFSTADELQSPSIARFTDIGAPWFIEHPVDVAVEEGDTVTLTARVSAAYAGANYIWQRNEAAIADGVGGASAGGGVVSGARGVITECETAAALTITGVRISDAGSYRLVIGNHAGITPSHQAHVTVHAPCPADFNADGVLTSQDFFDFLTALFAEWPSADFNDDAHVNSQDFFDFLGAFFGGC